MKSIVEAIVRHGHDLTLPQSAYLALNWLVENSDNHRQKVGVDGIKSVIETPFSSQ